MRDFLIIGQGIAGSVLGRMLEKEGKSFLVVDGKQTPSASRVAAGVWNPIAVKRFSKTWMADKTIPAAKAYFSGEESFFQDRFFFENQLLKLLSNKAEHAQMTRRWEEMLPFVEKDDSLEAAPGVEAPNGILRVKTAGYIDVPGFLDHIREHWIKSGNFIETHFKHSDLLNEDGHWVWKDHVFQGVVFCEGISGLQNPWMKQMNLENTKGQVLEVRIPELDTPHILNKHIFVLPQGNSVFRVGATNEWVFDDLLPTEAGKNELLEKLEKILPGKKVEIVRQDAGGRPTTTDRRPLMGALSEPGLFVFNGLGSRGVLLVPYLAACMCRYLLGDEEAIPEEGRLQRLKLK
ncbi:MAG: NAD(P)/FAD-dependent oxidoreductase [Bacteroidia bacterium]